MAVRQRRGLLIVQRRGDDLVLFLELRFCVLDPEVLPVKFWICAAGKPEVLCAERGVFFALLDQFVDPSGLDVGRRRPDAAAGTSREVFEPHDRVEARSLRHNHPVELLALERLLVLGGLDLDDRANVLALGVLAPDQFDFHVALLRAVLAAPQRVRETGLILALDEILPGIREFGR